jgi:hypothetical protein
MPPKTSARFDDPKGVRFGIPTWPWRCGPDKTELATERQLKAMGLRKGGRPPAGQLGWSRCGEDMFCPLYRVDLAKPKRPMTPAKWAAIRKAIAARRVCPTCKTEKPYEIPKRFGECNDCAGYATAA